MMEFNNKKLTEKGEEYNSYSEMMDEWKDYGYLKRDMIAAINHVGELNSMDLGEEVILFLAGMEYGKSQSKPNTKQ